MTDTLIQTPVSWTTGAVAKVGPMMVVNPGRQIVDEDLADVGAGTGLNSPFLADLVASCATHERCGVSLFKALEAQTDNPAAKHSFHRFQQDAMDAVGAYDTLADAIGVPVNYASNPARMTEAMDTRLLSAFLLSGSADQLTIELKGIEAVLLASTMCVANASLLRRIAEGLGEGDAKAAMEQALAVVMPPAEEHLEWAANMQQEMVLSQVNSSFAQKATKAAETVVGKVRDVLGR